MSDQKPPARRQPKARTPEDRDNQLVAAAYDLAERQIREGTASAQVITHLLKLKSQETRLKEKKLEAENELLKQKVEAMQRESGAANLLRDAMEAFTDYKGTE